MTTSPDNTDPLDCWYCESATAIGEYEGRPICQECLKREENREPPDDDPIYGMGSTEEWAAIHQSHAAAWERKRV